MKLFMLFVVLLLIAGPLRKPLLASWRTTLPVIAGGFLGFSFAVVFVRFGAPAWTLILGPLAGVLIIGSEGRKWFHDNFPP
jgi:hypothetical protein